MDLTRRSFLAGIGSVSVGLLFARKLDAVLDSLEQELVAEQQTPVQHPSAVMISVMPQMVFRPHRLVVSERIAPHFVIEDIWIGQTAMFAKNTVIPADVFSVNAVDDRLGFSAVMPGVEIRFRVRYIGPDPKGAVFQAAMFGRTENGSIAVLPISSGVAIV